VPNIVPIFEISNIEEMIKQKRLRMVWVEFDVKYLKPQDLFSYSPSARVNF
jgi:hypothetical protein